MKIRTSCSWCLLVGAFLVASPSLSPRAQAPARAGGSALARSLVGSWRLITWADRRGDGPWTHQFGEHPVGLFIYTADGHISIQVMRGGPPDAAPSGGTAPARGGGEGLGPFHAYFGTYTIDEAKHIVVHHVEASENPKMVGTDQPREFKLEGDRLIIGDEKARLRILERLKPLPELVSPGSAGRPE